MIEVEQKYRIDDLDQVMTRLTSLGAISSGDLERHEDTYYNHPCRDFAETTEAFRVRRVNGQPWMTYKGAKLAGSVKARREIELSIGTDPQDGQEFEDAIVLLGFRRVETVRKTRRTFSLALPDVSSEDGCSEPIPKVVIAVDAVESLGRFAEIEVIAQHDSEVEFARQKIKSAAKEIGLTAPESRSYLSMILG